MNSPARKILVAAAVFAFAGATTCSAADVDWGQRLFTSVNNLIDLDGGLFVHYGIAMVAAAAFCKLMYGLIMDGLARLGAIAGGHVHFDLQTVLVTLFQMWLLTQLLVHWMVPLPGAAHSLHQIPMYISDVLVSGLAASKADQFMGYVKTVSTNIEHPNPLMILDVAVYIIILMNMGILALVTFIITSFAYIGETIFVVIAPLLAWCTFFHTVFSWFWNCIQNMFAFAAYKVVGAIIIYILCDVMVDFFLNGVGNDYTIAHWIVLFPVVVMFVGLFVFSLFMIPLICASIFNGAGAVGQSVAVVASKFI